MAAEIVTAEVATGTAVGVTDTAVQVIGMAVGEEVTVIVAAETRIAVDVTVTARPRAATMTGRLRPGGNTTAIAAHPGGAMMIGTLAHRYGSTRDGTRWQPSELAWAKNDPCRRCKSSRPVAVWLLH